MTALLTFRLNIRVTALRTKGRDRTMTYEYEEAFKIAKKWFDIIGLGYNPELNSADYSPALNAATAREYDADMITLWSKNDGPEWLEIVYEAHADAIDEENEWMEYADKKSGLK